MIKRIHLPIIPPTATAQQKGVFVRGGRAHFYTKAKVREAEATYATLLMAHRPETPTEGEIYLHVTFTFPYRKSEPKRVTRNGDIIPHLQRPDLDNLEKNLIDTMTRLGFWSDDSQIFEKYTRKLRGPSPAVDIIYTDTNDTITNDNIG